MSHPSHAGPLIFFKEEFRVVAAEPLRRGPNSLLHTRVQQENVS